MSHETYQLPNEPTYVKHTVANTESGLVAKPASEIGTTVVKHAIDYDLEHAEWVKDLPHTD